MVIGELGRPDASLLLRDEWVIPFFFVADDAFACTWLMKPFSKRDLTVTERIFIYYLSRARRVVENAFWMLANHLGCLLTTLKENPETVTNLILACICVENIIGLRYKQVH